MPIGSLTTARPASLDPAGPAADDIASLWWFLLITGTVVFALVLALFVVPMVRRRRAGRPEAAADHRAEVAASTANRWIIGLGVVMPTVILIAVLVYSVWTMREVSEAAPDDAVVIEVVGYQFWWAASYADEDVTVANELHIPVGRPVELRMTSADVIHSFWAPELHGKLDLLPDGTNTLVLEASEAGVYGGECAEFCGIQHANMGFLVVAQPPEEFAQWLAAQQQPAAAPASAEAQRGAEIFLAEDCARCHVVRGIAESAEEVAPDLTHVASRQTLASDSIDNTPEELARWLRDPDAVKPGTTMPDTDLNDDQIADLIAFLETLE